MHRALFKTSIAPVLAPTEPELQLKPPSPVADKTLISWNSRAAIHLIAFFSVVLLLILQHTLFNDNVDNLEETIYFKGLRHESSRNQLIYALVASVACCGPLFLDIIVDWVTIDFSKVLDDRLERLMLSAYVAIPSIAILCLTENACFPIYFAVLHSSQHILCMSIVYVMLIRLFPAAFANLTFIVSFILYVIPWITVLLEFHFGNTHLQEALNITCIPLFFTSISIFVYCLRIWHRSSLESSLSTKVTCVMYITIGFATIYVVPFSVGIDMLFSWPKVSIVSCICLVYGLLVFGVLVNAVPVRYNKMQVDKANDAFIESRSLLIRYFGHEIRSPLNVMALGFNCLDTCSMDAEQQSAIKDMARECDAAVQILNGLLDLEKIDAGKFELDCSFMSLGKLNSLFADFSAFVHSKDMTFTVRNLIDLNLMSKFRIFIDEPRIRQVLRNLIVNSVKFTPVGGEITIETNLIPIPKSENSVSPSYKLHVFVIDNGVGIEAKNIGKVFTQFAQFDAKKLQGGGGSGLGLWIANQIMLGHGSKIEVSSLGAGLGATFSFTFDAFDSEDEPQVIHIKDGPIILPMNIFTRLTMNIFTRLAGYSH